MGRDRAWRTPAKRETEFNILDRMITLVIAVMFAGVQVAWTIFLGWAVLQLWHYRNG